MLTWFRFFIIEVIVDFSSKFWKCSLTLETASIELSLLILFWYYVEAGKYIIYGILHITIPYCTVDCWKSITVITFMMSYDSQWIYDIRRPFNVLFSSIKLYYIFIAVKVLILFPLFYHINIAERDAVRGKTSVAEKSNTNSEVSTSTANSTPLTGNAKIWSKNFTICKKFLLFF